MKGIQLHKQFKKKEFVKKDSDKKFGLTFSMFFLILSIAPLLKGHPAKLWMLALAVSLGIISFIKPSSLSYLKKVWLFFGEIIQKITSPIFLFLLFFFVFFPMGILMRLLKKDLLQLSFDRSIDTYWIKSEKVMTKFNDQF